MSGFVSKISAAGSKGWTGLQSLWDRDNKTPPSASPSGPPAEKTSLLSFSLPSRHPKGSRLLSEDDDWPDTPPPTDDGRQQQTADGSGESGTTFSFSSSSSTTTTTTTTTATAAAANPPTLTPTPTTKSHRSSPRVQPKAERERPMGRHGEWSSVSEEDEADVWLKGDSARRGILDTDKKKSTRESKRPSPRFKHKMASSSSSSSSGKGSEWKQDRGGFGSALGKLKGPAFGKLLDVECEEGEGRGGPSSSSSLSSSAAGCDNKVWADDDDDDEAQWKMMDNR